MHLWPALPIWKSDIRLLWEGQSIAKSDCGPVTMDPGVAAVLAHLGVGIA